MGKEVVDKEAIRDAKQEAEEVLSEWEKNLEEPPKAVNEAREILKAALSGESAS